MTNQETLEIGKHVTVRWATFRSDEYDYENGEIRGSFLNERDQLQYKVLIDGEIKTVPHYQIR